MTPKTTDCIFCAPDPCTCQAQTKMRPARVAKKTATKVAKEAAPLVAPVEVTPPQPPAPTPPVAPKKAGLRSMRTMATVIPRPKPTLPKTEQHQPQQTGRKDEMTVAISRMFLGGLIDEDELRRHRRELRITDEQFAALVSMRGE